MKTNIIIDISHPIPCLLRLWFLSCWPKYYWPKFILDNEVFYKLILSFWVCIVGHPQKPKIRSLHIFDISPEKRWGFKCIFCAKINMKSLCKLIASHWVCVARHAQSTQNWILNRPHQSQCSTQDFSYYCNPNHVSIYIYYQCNWKYWFDVYIYNHMTAFQESVNTISSIFPVLGISLNKSLVYHSI